MTIWLAHLEKLKTGDSLMDKGIITPQQALCPFCSLEVETNSHVLFTCTFSWGIWMDLLNEWGILGVLHMNCENFYNEWSGLSIDRNRRRLWNLVLGCTILSIWYMRNKVKFEMVNPEQRKVIYSLKIRIGLWAKEILGYERITPLVSNKESLPS